MRKEMIDDEPKQYPVVSQASTDQQYFNQLQDAAALASALGVSPAAGWALNIVGTEICLLQGGTIQQCMPKQW